MTDRAIFGEDLTIPFIFVPHGEPESPEVAAFKARHPSWFSIPATFVPHAKEPLHQNEMLPPRGGPSGIHSPFPPPPTIDRSYLRGEPGSSLRAFQRANALQGDPVAALRALRDTPEAFTDNGTDVQVAQAVPLTGESPSWTNCIRSD